LKLLSEEIDFKKFNLQYAGKPANIRRRAMQLQQKRNLNIEKNRNAMSKKMRGKYANK